MRITPPVTDYRAPTPKDLQVLKEHFGLTAYEMARLFAVQPEQWRKHTGGQVPREISVTRAFFMAARDQSRLESSSSLRCERWLLDDWLPWDGEDFWLPCCDRDDSPALERPMSESLLWRLAPLSRF